MECVGLYVQVAPEDVLSKSMDMGDVLRGDSVEKVITITNTGSYLEGISAAV